MAIVSDVRVPRAVLRKWSARGAPPAPSRSDRVRSLDGLRGFAALVVVVHHCLLTDGVLAAPYAGRRGGRFPDFSWWLTYTPLHLVWAGPEAVLVFFVLSGFVLTQATERDGFTWRAYFSSRLLRLYLPSWAALALAVAVIQAVPRAVQAGNWWMSAHARPVETATIVHDAVVVQGTTWIDGPLWSLKWEVLFSILLPLFVTAAWRRRSSAIAQVGLLVALTGLGASAGQGGVRYLPMFGVGVVMARQREGLRSFGERLSRWSWAGLTLLAVLLLTASWTLEHPAAPWSVPLETVGAALAVFVFAFWRPVRAAAESRRAQWLGGRSFALYLVHEPIVVSVALLLGAGAGPLLTLAVAVPSALIAGHLFFVCCERPSHRIAQAVNRKLRAEAAGPAAELRASGAA